MRNFCTGYMFINFHPFRQELIMRIKNDHSRTKIKQSYRVRVTLFLFLSEQE